MNRFCGREYVRWFFALAAVVMVTAGCAHVKQDDFNTEMDRLRQEIREGDQAVENRLGQRMDQVESRIESRMAQLEGELGQLRNEFQVTVERLEAAVRFNTPVHFGFDEHTIRSQDQPLLDRMAEVLRGYYPEAVITLEGFTDPAGSAAYNLRLGERRAEAVRDYLANSGIPSDRMRTVSYGQASERQIVQGAQGPGEEGWQNRRVAVVVDFSPAATGRTVAQEDSPEQGG